MEWVKAFNEMLVSKGNQPYDPDTLLAWFSNAIMTGHDFAYSKFKAEGRLEGLEEAAKIPFCFQPATNYGDQCGCPGCRFAKEIRALKEKK